MKKALILLALLVSLVTFFAVSAAEPVLKLNILALPGTTGLSLVKVFADRPSLGPGVAAEYSVVKSPEQMTARILAGEADIAALPTNTAAILYNKGVAIKLAAITNWGVTYVVGREPVRSWSDLKGRDIGVTGRGAAPDLLFRYYLIAAGLQPEKDLRIQYYASAVELSQLLVAGKTDLAVLPEPWVSEALARDKSLRILLDLQKEWKRREAIAGSYPQSCLVVSSRLAEERPEVLAAFLKQAAVSSAWVNRHREEAGRLAEEYIQISAAAARDAIPRCNLRFTAAADARAEVRYYLEKLLAFEPQAVGGRLPDARFYAEK